MHRYYGHLLQDVARRYVVCATVLVLMISAMVVGAAAQAPTVDSVAPSGGSGNATLTFKFSDASAYANLNFAQVIINESGRYSGGCAFMYLQGGNRIYLMNDAGTTWAGSVTVGAPGVVSNSQCGINGQGVLVEGSGTQLTLNVSIVFSGTFIGQKNIYGYAASVGGNSKWQKVGTWTPVPPTVVPIPTAPTVDRVTPADAAGNTQNLTFQFSSVNGYQYIDWVQGIINGQPRYSSSCSFYYVRPTNQVYLMDDAGTTWRGPALIGQAGSLSNAQCTIDMAKSSISSSGNSLSLTLAITESASVSGLQNVYAYAMDHGGLKSGWATLGKWLPNAPPSMTPPRAVSADYVGSKTIFSFASDNGADYIGWVQAIVGNGTGYAKSCSIYYQQGSRRLYLMNDAGSTWLGPVVVGQSLGSIANSQCVVEGGTSSATVDGQTLRLDVDISYAPGFAGVLTTSGYASDKGGRNSGWTKLGRLNVGQTGTVRIGFLHHSTGGNIWGGGVLSWMQSYNTAHGTTYQISERAYPDTPYPWANYPYDYWNLWVNSKGPSNSTQPGVHNLETLTADYDVIVFKHCFPVSSIGPDTGHPDAASPTQTLENYKAQYELLKTRLHQFPNKKFIVWTGAALVASATDPASAQRARDFFTWVKNQWDEQGDNIFVWDFYELETEGTLYLKDGYSAGGSDSHPNATFSQTVAPYFARRVVNVVEGRGDTTRLDGKD